MIKEFKRAQAHGAQFATETPFQAHKQRFQSLEQYGGEEKLKTTEGELQKQNKKHHGGRQTESKLFI